MKNDQISSFSKLTYLASWLLFLPRRLCLPPWTAQCGRSSCPTGRCVHSHCHWPQTRCGGRRSSPPSLRHKGQQRAPQYTASARFTLTIRLQTQCFPIKGLVNYRLYWLCWEKKYLLNSSRTCCLLMFFRKCTCGIIAVAFVFPAVIGTVTVVCVEQVNVFIVVAR